MDGVVEEDGRLQQQRVKREQGITYYLQKLSGTTAWMRRFRQIQSE